MLDFLSDAFWGAADWLYHHRVVFWLVIAVLSLGLFGVLIYYLAHWFNHVWYAFDWNTVPDLTPKQFEWSVLFLLFLNWLKSTSPSVTVQCKHKDKN